MCRKIFTELRIRMDSRCCDKWNRFSMEKREEKLNASWPRLVPRAWKMSSRKFIISQIFESAFSHFQRETFRSERRASQLSRIQRNRLFELNYSNEGLSCINIYREKKVMISRFKKEKLLNNSQRYDDL